jgi:uncharacterized membrane protein
MDTPNNSVNNEVKDSGKKAEGVNVEPHVLMGILSYIGFLVFIPFFTSKKDPFVKFHIKQGLVLFCIEIIVWILGQMFFWHLWSLLQLINLAILVLSIIGIINVVQKKEKMLPIVGGLSSYFKF